MTEEPLADQWLESIDRVGRVLTDVVEGIPALDEMERLRTRPTVGWMMRNTRKSTPTVP